MTRRMASSTINARSMTGSITLTSTIRVFVFAIDRSTNDRMTSID
jgi:hypothetical protein